MQTAKPDRALRTGRAGFLAFILGAISVGGFAPFHAFPLPIFGTAALALILLRTTSARQAIVLGYAFGLGLLLTGTSWVYVSLHDYGGMPAPLAAFSTLLFCAIYAMCPATSAWLIHRIHAPDAIKLMLVFPAAWSLSDWVRGWLFTGFPWLALGYSQVPSSPLAGFGPVFGVYGISLFICLIAASLALIYLRLSQNRRRGAAGRQVSLPIAVVTLVTVCAFVMGKAEWTQPTTNAPVSVTLIQGNIPQEMKWRPERARETLLTYLELVRASTSTLIVLPETALPMFDVNLPEAYLDTLGEHARARQGDILTGIPEYVGKNEYYNSVISIGSSAQQTYRKVHLVPFGDYFPMQWAFGWFMRMVDIPMSNFSRGAPDQTPLGVAGEQVAVSICYEDVFGEEVIRQLPAATLLANFTNDAWWGRSLASSQHLQIAQMRSIETGRAMLRATNTGMTAIIDHRGHIQVAAPEFETTAISANVQGRSGTTPYVLWGNYAFLLISALMLAAALGLSVRAGRTQNGAGPG